jgi:hypothetical protein
MIFALVAGVCSCDSKPAPPPLSKAVTSVSVQPEATATEEVNRRARYEGKRVFTIACDFYWHTSEHCQGLEVLKVGAPVVELVIRKGTLLEGNTPFRERWACPTCA